MNIRPRKRFGQHFLVDESIIASIVEAIRPQENDTLVEIGPGQGALTVALLSRVKKMQAIELDRDLIPLLENTCKNVGEIEIIQADALTFDFGQFKKPLRIVGNLPYNISTPLLFHLLEFAGNIIDMHFMLQKEVVDRICATPNHKAYGRLSVMIQYACDVESLFQVEPDCFNPPPKVDSAVVRLIPKKTKVDEARDHKALESLVKQAFSQRRKTIRNTLKGRVTADQLVAVGIDPQARAENITVQQFVELANRCDAAHD